MKNHTSTLPSFSDLAGQLNPHAFAELKQGTLYGLEKEGLRTDAQGFISQASHPICLGSALTHPHITTDYSEALMEFITAPHANRLDALNALNTLHQWTYSCIKQEYIWPSSMPCALDGDKSIPIARYGTSNIGQMKHVYRKGLEVRYGRTMQSIAGLHYNFSIPDAFWRALYEVSEQSIEFKHFKSAGYFALIRNFRRYGWLLTYLFGSSPALDTSFFHGREHDLNSTGQRTAYRPFATCLRMTDLGYKSEAQKQIKVCYNTLESYIATLEDALKHTHPEYSDMGLKQNGEYIQLSTHLLQIENEFYSEIRPKRTPNPAQKPLEALDQDGVDYIEVRLLDLNPMHPLGIDENGLAFIEAFLIMCLLEPSPACDEQEDAHIKANFFNTAKFGRDPALHLNVNNTSDSLQNHARAIMNKIRATHEHLAFDDVTQTAIDQYAKTVEDSHLTPSAILLETILNGKDHLELSLEQAQLHKKTIGDTPSAQSLDEHQKMASASHQRQREIEASDSVDFDTFLNDYYHR